MVSTALNEHLPEAVHPRLMMLWLFTAVLHGKLLSIVLNGDSFGSKHASDGEYGNALRSEYQKQGFEWFTWGLWNGSFSFTP